jgi:CBS domain-containing protein
VALLTCGLTLAGAAWWNAGRPRVATVETEELPPEKPAPVERFVDKRQRILRSLSSDVRRLFDRQIPVRKAMTARVETVLPAAPVDVLRERFLTEGIRHLLVVDAERRLVGMISDRDVASRRGQRAEQIMTRDPVFVEPETLLSQAITMILKHRIHALPVVDEGRVTGIITSSDLLMTLQCCIQLLQRLADAPECEEELGADRP